MDFGIIVDSSVIMVENVYRNLAAGACPELPIKQRILRFAREIDRPTGELRDVFLPALERIFPRAREARVESFFVTRERVATFRQAAETAALRPPAPTAIPGLYLAGAYTDTGWPATMEGAVRSGLTAANHVLAFLERTRDCREVAA